jgi:hypothetical protein
MQCQNCHQPVPDDEPVCPGCGSLAAEEPQDDSPRLSLLDELLFGTDRALHAIGGVIEGVVGVAVLIGIIAFILLRL